MAAYVQHHTMADVVSKSIKTTKNGSRKASFSTGEKTSEYATFSDALHQVLQVSRSEMQERIKAAKKERKKT